MPTIGEHPWTDHLNIRRDFKITCNFEQCDQDPAPHKFNDRNLIRSPDDSRVLTIRECITLQDVIAYRDETTRLSKIKKTIPDVSSLTAQLENLSVDTKNFQVIYRFTDIIKNKTQAILEAIHFEIFMPDRPDLRFIVMPITLLPWDACEGDYYEAIRNLQIYSVKHTPRVCNLTIGQYYMLSFTVTQFDRVERHGTPAFDYIYVAEKDLGSDDCKAVCNWTSNYIMPRHRRFNKTATEKFMEVHRIYDANLVDTSSAWIYPVEPPKNREEYSKLVQLVSSTSHYAGTFAEEISILSNSEQFRIDDRLRDFHEFSKNMQMAEQHMIRLFKLGVRFRQLATPPPKENVFVQHIDPPRLQVYTEVFFLDAVTLHFEEQDIKLTVENIKRENQGKKKNTYIHCVRSPDLVRLLGSRRDYLWIDATFHGQGGSATEKILDRIDREMISVEETGEVKPRFLIDERIPNLIQSVYGRGVSKHTFFHEGCYTVKKSNGQLLTLNEQQSHAMEIYNKMRNSGYCILSPPGSGKTTVAAAMAATIVKDQHANRQGSVQMLLAVQNVAVENLAIALKSFDDGTLKSYRLLSRVRTDPHDPTPYDIFEHLPSYMRWMKNAEPRDRMVMESFLQVEKAWKKSEQKGSSLGKQAKDELDLRYTQAMFQAKGMLEKYMKPQIILSTVDLVMYKLLDISNNGVRGQFWDVDRIIIDEASLLTESTFYCLVRCFPKASFVLIGDDKQLPPFMYDHKVLGHEIAGRAALNVAMKWKNLPIIQLVEVYRAPQQLVQPYNNLSYNGTLISKKIESKRPLFQAGLVAESRPDLLLVDIPKGHQKGTPSAYNEMEIEVMIKLLRQFPKKMHDDIMIICLYKEQKKRLQRRLGPDYEIMTVDSSQGKEKPIVIVLTTRTEKVTDFFSNQNRCTVAVSRHQRALIILGNNSLLSHRLPWSKVLEDFTRIEADQLPEPKWTPDPIITPVNAWFRETNPLPHQTTPSFGATDFPSLAVSSKSPSTQTQSSAPKNPWNKCPAPAEFPSLGSSATESTQTSTQPSTKNPWNMSSLNVPETKDTVFACPHPAEAKPSVRTVQPTPPPPPAVKKVQYVPIKAAITIHPYLPTQFGGHKKKKTTQQRAEQRKRAKERAANGEGLPQWRIAQNMKEEANKQPPRIAFEMDSSDFPSLNDPVPPKPTKRILQQPTTIMPAQPEEFNEPVVDPDVQVVLDVVNFICLTVSLTVSSL